MRGGVDLSRWAEADMSENQGADLWARARVAGVFVTVVGLERGGFFAMIAGRGAQASATHVQAYRAACLALEGVERLGELAAALALGAT